MVAGGIGTILTAGYFLWMLQRVNMGTVPEKWQDAATSRRPARRVGLVDAAARRRSVALGVFPRLVFGVTQEPVDALMHLFGG